jgi:DNA-binding response OmpR family regulator
MRRSTRFAGSSVVPTTTSSSHSPGRCCWLASALLRRQEAERPPILHFADLALDTGERRAHGGKRDIDLTTTEYELLRQFLEHPRRALPREFLMDRVWGYEFYGGTNVLETYVKQLRQKLEAAGEPRLIHTLRGTGYILREG